MQELLASETAKVKDIVFKINAGIEEVEEIESKVKFVTNYVGETRGRSDSSKAKVLLQTDGATTPSPIKFSQLMK